jgi:hypothetical protein
MMTVFLVPSRLILDDRATHSECQELALSALSISYSGIKLTRRLADSSFPPLTYRSRKSPHTQRSHEQKPPTLIRLWSLGTPTMRVIFPALSYLPCSFVLRGVG